jgi:hypothetical protein
MLSTIRSRFSSAHVIAIIALFVALSGTALALKKNSVKSKNIKNETVQSKDIKNGDVASVDLTDGDVSSVDIKDEDVSAVDLKDGDVGSAELGANVVLSSELGTITERTEAFSIADDATPHERQEVDCLDNEQAIGGDVSPSILSDDDELMITESNYDPNGGAPANDTGWIFGLANLDDTTGYGNADNTAITGSITVLCLAP